MPSVITMAAVYGDPNVKPRKYIPASPEDYKDKTRQEYETAKDAPRQSFFREDTEEKYRLDKVRRLTDRVHSGFPRLEEEKIEPLKLVSSSVIGSIFDRVKFLEERISEIHSNVELRGKLHADIIVEIDQDINEKESLMTMVSDINEKRNFKVDISVLRKEKRHEAVQFWKDVVELKSELRELQEQYEVENKIADLFKNLKDDTVGGSE